MVELGWPCSPIVPLSEGLLTCSAAALLHDCLDKKYVSPEQAADPFAFFLPFFTSMANTHGLDLIADGRAQLVATIVDNVSWSTEKKLRETGRWTDWHDSCAELHCVQDGDRLDAIGAFGDKIRFTTRFSTDLPETLPQITQ